MCIMYKCLHAGVHSCPHLRVYMPLCINTIVLVHSLVCIASSLLCACVTFHSCIIGSFCKRLEHCNWQHMLGADRHLPLMMDLGGMDFSSGCLDLAQHVGRHMPLRVNLIDWMAPNSLVQASSGRLRVNPSKWRMSRGATRSSNRLAWTSSHIPTDTALRLGASLAAGWPDRGPHQDVVWIFSYYKWVGTEKGNGMHP